MSRQGVRSPALLLKQDASTTAYTLCDEESNGMIRWYRIGTLFTLLGPKSPQGRMCFSPRLGPSWARSVNRRGTPTGTEGACTRAYGRCQPP
jgi:hypothetical protein